MPRFLHNSLINQIKLKREKSFPLLYMIFVVGAFLLIDILYRYLNYGILFDPDIIHILFIDITIALLLMIILVVFPNILKKYIIICVLVFFTTMSFLYTTLGFSGVIQTSVGNIEVFQELGKRLITSFQPIQLLLFAPILLALVPIRIKYTAPKYLIMILLFIISVFGGSWYLQVDAYNNSQEATNNLEKIIYNDEGTLLFSRLGSNIGLIRNMVNYDGYNIPADNVVSEANNYLQNELQRNDYTNIYKDKNLVIIEIDGLDYMAVNEDVMPTLWSLTHTGMNFTNYFDEKTLTSNFEMLIGFQENSKSLNSILTYGQNSYPNAIGNQLRSLRYSTVYVENNKGQFQFETEFIKRAGFQHYYDSASYKQDSLNALDLTSETAKVFFQYDKFYVHMKFSDLLEQPLDYSEDSNTITGDVSDDLLNYFSYANVVDQAISRVIESVSIAGELNNTVFIVASTGHPSYFEDDFIREYSDKRTGLYINRVPFIIWDNSTTKTINEPMTAVNLPATLDNMFDFRTTGEYIAPDVFARGGNVVSFNDRSWISEAGFYESTYQRFTVTDEIYLTDYLDAYIEITNQTVYDRYLYSRIVLENNYFALIFI